MDGSFIIGLIIYLLPVTCMAWLGFTKRLCWSVALSLLVLAPAVGDLSYVVYLVYVVPAFHSNSIAIFAISLYPFAVIPLGFWASAIGCLVYNVVKDFNLSSRFRPLAFFAGSAIVGVVIGVAFFASYTGLITTLVSHEHFGYNPLYPLLLAGAVAGAMSGVVVGFLSSSQRMRRTA